MFVLFGDLAQCAMRDRTDDLCGAGPRYGKAVRPLTSDALAEFGRSFPEPREPKNLKDLPFTRPDFLERLGELAACDPYVARRIVDDRKDSMIWGHTTNIRACFLQQCIRGCYKRASELWWALGELDRRDFAITYERGIPPRPDFFLRILVPDLDDCVSTCSTREESFSGFDVQSACGSNSSSSTVVEI